MKKLMDRLYDNLEDAKAFALSFTNFAYFYDDFDYAGRLQLPIAIFQ